MSASNQHSERNPEHTWERYLELMDENTRLKEQLEAEQESAERWKGWFEEKVEQLETARLALEEIRNAASAAGSGEMSVLWVAERARRGLGESSPASAPGVSGFPESGDSDSLPGSRTSGDASGSVTPDEPGAVPSPAKEHPEGGPI